MLLSQLIRFVMYSTFVSKNSRHLNSFVVDLYIFEGSKKIYRFCLWKRPIIYKCSICGMTTVRFLTCILWLPNRPSLMSTEIYGQLNTLLFPFILCKNKNPLTETLPNRSTVNVPVGCLLNGKGSSWFLD